ncbi:unnamed protein product [Cercospora beticola]|nr:unnamed protein product [Cercospora beticola]
MDQGILSQTNLCCALLAMAERMSRECPMPPEKDVLSGGCWRMCFQGDLKPFGADTTNFSRKAREAWRKFNLSFLGVCACINEPTCHFFGTTSGFASYNYNT